MRLVTRLAVVALAGLTALAVGGTALAVPKLTIGGKLRLGESGIVIRFTEEKNDAAPAKVQISMAPGYGFSLEQAVGTQIGTVHADLQALQISPDAIIQADGTILVADPSKYVANTCVPGAHPAVWLLRVTVSGQTIDIPAYVDSPSTGDPLAASASLKLRSASAHPTPRQEPPARRSASR